jgi:hypothetical protein
MADRTREASKTPRSTTVLDPLRPAVVVRRRVYDTTLLEKSAETPRAFTAPPSSSFAESDVEAKEADEDESGPPSSINVARALASLRSDELQRVEDLVRADEAEVEAPESTQEEPVASEPAPPTQRTLVLGKTIALSELARRMGVSAQELPATLVARGFYALDARTVLQRETARAIAEIYGWHVEVGPPELDEAPPMKSGPRSRIATRKVVAKAKPKPKVKVKARSVGTKHAKAVKPSKPSKPAKRRIAR